MRETHPPTLRFLGAADTVTGSRYLLLSQGHRVLIECGLFQGYKNLRDRNRVPFQINPANIDAVVLTHAHLDHSGYVPALVRDGFRGPVYATPGTSELCTLLLPDNGYLQEEEARYADHKASSTHHPPPRPPDVPAQSPGTGRCTGHRVHVRQPGAPGWRP